MSIPRIKFRPNADAIYSLHIYVQVSGYARGNQIDRHEMLCNATLAHRWEEESGMEDRQT